MSRHHNRPRPWDAPPGAVPGELRGQAGSWLAETGDAGANGGTGLTAARSLLLDPPGLAAGWQEAIPLPSPAAGAQWSRTVPGPFTERLVTVTWLLTTDAVVANRFPQIQLADAQGRIVVITNAAGTVLAGSTVRPSLHVKCSNIPGNPSGVAPGWLPDVLAPAGWTWSSVTSGMDAGDTITAVMLTMYRFPAAQAGDPLPRHHEEST